MICPDGADSEVKGLHFKPKLEMGRETKREIEEGRERDRGRESHKPREKEREGGRSILGFNVSMIKCPSHSFNH